MTLSPKRRVRLVNSLVIHGDAIDFRELCRRSIEPDTEYMVLDLDRTFHLGHNMGELLGYELCAYHAYGLPWLKAHQKERGQGRFFMNWKEPFKALHYLALGVKHWAWPGLYYLMWCKLAVKNQFTRRMSFLRFGPEPVRAVQRIPQTALMSQMAAVPLEVLRDLARGVWERHVADQVIDAEDITWLRERCPGIKIIISSASPQPMLEAAQEALGVDDVLYSKTEEQDGYLSAPWWLLPMVTDVRPERITRPSLQHINSSFAKIDHLALCYPDMFKAGAKTVGVTDTGYGEDHCWAQHFTKVIDVNSSAPFAPIVAADSPLKEVHSASILTRNERLRRAEGQGDYIDARRTGSACGPMRHFSQDELRQNLGPVMAEVEKLSALYQEACDSLKGSRNNLEDLTTQLIQTVEKKVNEFNQSTGRAKAQTLENLRRLVRQESSLRKQLAQVERPLSEINFRLSEALQNSRSQLEIALPHYPEFKAPRS